MAGLEVLKIVHNRDTLGLGGSEEVILDRIRAAERCQLLSQERPQMQRKLVSLVAKRDLDWALKTMCIPVVPGALVRFMLLHQR